MGVIQVGPCRYELTPKPVERGHPGTHAQDPKGHADEHTYHHATAPIRYGSRMLQNSSLTQGIFGEVCFFLHV